MIYTVMVTVDVVADSEHQAYHYIQDALDAVYINAEVTAQRPEHDDEEPPKKLTRQERLQGLADAGCDTWQEFREER